MSANWSDRSARPDPGSNVSEKSNPDPTWWRSFKDPILTTLIQQSIAGNLDLQQAVLRVVEARQGIVIARSAGLPSLNGTGSYAHEQLGLRGILQSQGVYSQLNSLADQTSTTGSGSAITGQSVKSALGGALNQVVQPVDLFQYGLDASWELDLFGRVRRSVEQAKATTEAQAEAANDSLVMLEGQVAQTYVQLRGNQALLATQQDNIRSATASLDLTQRARRNGLVSDLNVEQARTQLYDFQRQLPSYESQIQQAKNQLSVLTGQPPGAVDTMLKGSAPLPRTPDVIGIGVPSTLARRRPDIREAEANLHAATANTGIATANFYPDISLTGNLGIRAIDASYLTSWASHFYSVGPSVSIPIFRGGNLTGNLRLARAQQAEAALKYRGTVLNALREVENALVAYRTDRAARDKLIQTVQSAELSLYLGRNQYQNGLGDFLTVLNAQQTVTTARQNLVQAEMTLINDVVALYKALGGGWQEPGTKIQVPSIESDPPIVPGALDSVAGGRADTNVRRSH